jgi:hypothetical protein
MDGALQAAVMVGRDSAHSGAAHEASELKVKPFMKPSQVN